MSTASRLPAGATIAAYCAAGFCLWTSGSQMHEVFSSHSVGASGSDSKPILLCLAILCGGAVSWRLLGHMVARKAHARTFWIATALVALAAIYTEGMSISTSAMSLTTGVNARISEDKKTSAGYLAAQSATDAAGKAAQRMAQNLERMPENYISAGNKAAEQLTELLAQQERLLTMQQSGSAVDSPTAKTMADLGKRFGMSAEDVQFKWALGIALALSLIPLSTQIALGTLSDGSMTEKAARNAGVMSTPEPAQAPVAKPVSPGVPRGNVRRLFGK